LLRYVGRISPKQRSEIARRAALARWGKRKGQNGHGAASPAEDSPKGYLRRR